MKLTNKQQTIAWSLGAAMGLCLLSIRSFAGMLSWNAVTADVNGNAITPTQYTVYEANKSMLSMTAAQAAADGTITKIPVAGTSTSLVLNPGTGTWYFRLTATDGTGESAFNVDSTGADVEVSTSIGGAAASQNPVAYWKFDDGSGSTAFDASGNDNNGTLAGASWSVGKFGGAVSLSGAAGSAVTAPNSPSLSLSSAFTMAAWVSPSAAMSTFKAIMVKNYDFFLYGSVAGYCGNGGIMAGFGGGTVCFPTPLTPGVWTHVAAAYDGSSLVLYVNGTQVASAAASGPLAQTGGTMQIGASQFGENFPGAIDEARVYNRALSAAEIQSLLSAPPAVADSIWTITPSPATNSIDPTALEAGVKFRSDVAGMVTGIKFFKAAGNLGTHVGNLWTLSGQKLASVTFANETATGWQTATFSSPVQINPNTLYVASYFAPQGNWSGDMNYFATAAADNPPLHAAATTESPNGVYVYSTVSAFPTQTYSATNYWVDVTFTPGGTTIALSPAKPSGLTLK